MISLRNGVWFFRVPFSGALYTSVRRWLLATLWIHGVRRVFPFASNLEDPS